MVSKNTLITDAWDSVYTYIRTTNPLSTTNIFSAWNSTLIENKGYPIVIVAIPQIDYTKLNLTGEFVSCEVTIPFEIYHKTAQDMILWLEEKDLLNKQSFRYLEPYCRKEISIHNRDLYVFQVSVKKEYKKYLV